MTRDEARAAFKDAGITYKALTPETLDNLRRYIDERMKESGLAGGTYRMSEQGTRLVKAGDGAWAVLRCQSKYFKDREAVTFNPDGFVGFAGWADETHVQPVLEGFTAWIAAMQPETAPAP